MKINLALWVGIEMLMLYAIQTAALAAGASIPAADIIAVVVTVAITAVYLWLRWQRGQG